MKTTIIATAITLGSLMFTADASAQSIFRGRQFGTTGVTYVQSAYGRPVYQNQGYGFVQPGYNNYQYAQPRYAPQYQNSFYRGATSNSYYGNQLRYGNPGFYSNGYNNYNYSNGYNNYNRGIAISSGMFGSPGVYIR